MSLKAMPFELTYADNNQFLLQQRPSSWTLCLPTCATSIWYVNCSRLTSTSSYENVEWVIGTLRNATKNIPKMIVPVPEGSYYIQLYQAMYYDDGLTPKSSLTLNWLD